MRCGRTTWRGREACLIGNEVVELTMLAGGGHIVDFHFTKGSGLPVANPFWVPRWKSIEPFDFDARRDARLYGPAAIGKTLAGIAGHSLCLDLFGMPSEEESRLGGTLHGEAGVLRWRISATVSRKQSELHCSVRLPSAGLRFTRSLTLRSGESVVYIREAIENERKVDQFFQWQQHVTLGAPFLAPRDCTIGLPGARGLTYAPGYEGHELLKSGKEFRWPYAPRLNRGRVDLRQTLTARGRGFVTGVQLAPNRKTAFVCALNTKLSVAIGYCFRREDYPWAALWEENRARRYPPWKGREQTRGLEFGASPLPLTRAENLFRGRVFGTPTSAHVPARGTRIASYVLFLAALPQGLSSIAEVVAEPAAIALIAPSGKAAHSLPASAIPEYLP